MNEQANASQNSLPYSWMEGAASGPRLSQTACVTPGRSFTPFVARLLSQEAESYAAALSTAGRLPAEDSNSFREL